MRLCESLMDFPIEAVANLAPAEMPQSEATLVICGGRIRSALVYLYLLRTTTHSALKEKEYIADSQ